MDSTKWIAFQLLCKLLWIPCQKIMNILRYLYIMKFNQLTMMTMEFVFDVRKDIDHEF